MARVLWLADVLRAAGLKVVEVDGWKTRGEDVLKPTKVVLFHHTGTSETAKGDYPTLNTIIHGRSDLAGPLSQMGVGRSGTWYVIASGKANHAGKGAWGHVTSSFETLGVEVEDSGDGKWSMEQVEAVEQGMAAILKHLGLTPAEGLCGHKEWALPAGRKVDPAGIDMTLCRQHVARIMAGGSVPRSGVPGHGHRTPTLTRGSHDPAVNDLQGHLNKAYEKYPEIAPLRISGVFDERTDIRLRDWQRRTGLAVDGVVGPTTWARLHEVTQGIRIDEHGVKF